MPHINYARGETRTFVYRRSGGSSARAGHVKGARNTDRHWKRAVHHADRQELRSWRERGSDSDRTPQGLPPVVRWWGS